MWPHRSDTAKRTAPVMRILTNVRHHRCFQVVTYFRPDSAVAAQSRPALVRTATGRRAPLG
jgi:hypothetical protein